MTSTQRYEKYLGLPSLVEQSKISTFTGIKGKIWSRLNGRKEKIVLGGKRNFSQGGYEGFPNLHDDCLPTTKDIMQGHKFHDVEVLVGA